MGASHTDEVTWYGGGVGPIQCAVWDPYSVGCGTRAVWGVGPI